MTTSPVFGQLPTPKSTTPGDPPPARIGAIESPPGVRAQVAAFRQDWPELMGRGADLRVELVSTLAEEEYKLTFGDPIRLRASGPTGVAWGLQTLGQILASSAKVSVVRDSPDFHFRCVMIDVARRYHSPSTLRRIVKWAQLGKVRYLQLHLTDDQNWMLPTEVLRGVDARNTHGKPAYTRQELQDLQAYAAARGITLIPEIDLPGHSTLLVQLDPAIYRIQGLASSNCINFGSPKVRAKMAALVDEVAGLFPGSPYIHLGGDEAWYPDAEKDPLFAQTLKEAGPGATPGDVFVDFVSELAQRVLGHGKTPIVWEGFHPSDRAKAKFPKQGIVIAWEGDYYPADRLIADGFKIVNGGWDPGYVVNHYPYDAYTLVPLARLYQWNPRVFGLVNWPNGVPRATDLGATSQLQGGLMCWWEGHEWNAQRVLPRRIAAFGARLWNAAGETDYPEFLRRVEARLARIDRVSFPVPLGVRGREVMAPAGAQVALRTDGGIPTLADLKTDVKLDSGGVVTAQAFRGGKPWGETRFLPIHLSRPVENLALGARAWTDSGTDPDFPASLVTDGVADNVGSFWLAYPSPAILMIDLRKVRQLSRIEVVTFWAAGQPARYRLAVSLDGKEWTQVADASQQKAPSTKEGYTHTFPSVDARYIRLESLGSDQFPSTFTRIHEVRAFGK